MNVQSKGASNPNRAATTPQQNSLSNPKPTATDAPGDRLETARPIPAEGQTKAWSFLFYNVGQGSLTSMATNTVQQLEQIGSDSNTHIVALNYRERAPHEELLHRFTAYQGARSYYITQNPKPTAQNWLGPDLGSLADCALSGPHKIQSPQLDNGSNPLTAAQMSSPDTLKAFLLENIQRFPSQHIALAITGHGAAFQGQAITRSAQGRAALTNDAIATVLNDVAQQTGQQVELINLNTCYSANLESLYGLKDSTAAIVASQDTVAVATQPFAQVIGEVQQRLASGQAVEPLQLAQIYVDKAHQQPLHQIHTPSLSAIDTSALGNLGDQLAAFQQSCIEHQISPSVLRNCLQEALAIDFSQEPRQVQLTDLGSLMTLVAKKVDNPTLRQNANQVLSALKSTVLAEQHAVASDENWVSKAVRSLPYLVGPQKDLTGASGLTVFWDPQETRRLDLISQSAFGQDHPVTQFMNYLAQP
jgi:hypothetical protein